MKFIEISKEGLGKKKGTLDEIDYKILELLSENPRATYAEIASKVQLSRDGVKYRILRMINSKLILGFELKLDLKQLGFTQRCILYIAFANLTLALEREFEQYIAKNSFVQSWYKIVGNWDYSVVLFAKDNTHLDSIVREFREKFSNEIKGIEVVPIVD